MTGIDDRIDKLHLFPLFSGEEPTLKDECGIETFFVLDQGSQKELNRSGSPTGSDRFTERGS